MACLLAATRDDPAAFNDLILGRPPYWERQLEICRDLARHKTVVVATGNAVGKSFLGAGLVLWWLYTRPGAQVLATAPSQTLLGTVLYKEIRGAFRRARVQGISLPGRITQSVVASPQILDVDRAGWHAIGIATTGVERISGQHHGELLQVIDEGSGVQEDIWEGLDSQSPAKRLILGNPLSIDNRFYLSYRRGERERLDDSIPDRLKTVSIKIPSTDSPDAARERSPVGMADATFLAEAERDWGRDSLWWKTHIAAEFPAESHEALIPAPWVDAVGVAVRTAPTDWSSVVMGVDLAAGVDRDRTVILVRDARGILEALPSAAMDLPHAARAIAELARKWRIPADRIVYDANGIGRELPAELRIYGLNGPLAYFGGASGGARFANRRSACAWALRRRLDPHLRAPGTPDLDPIPPDKSSVRRQLPGLEPPAPSALPLPVRQPPFHAPDAPWWWSMAEELKQLKYFNIDAAKIGLEKKSDYARRLGRSPDLADALIMSFALGDD